MDPPKRDENAMETETDSFPPTEHQSESEPDAKLISKIFGNKNKNDEHTPDGQSMEEEEYRMDHGRRGKAIIFNHWEFKDNVKGRNGAKVDQNRLELEFRSLGFVTDICENYTVQELKNKLAEVAEEDHSDADCLAVVVMSHGRSGEIHAFDGIYREKELWNHFTGDKCPQLRGKPKLFFIQACRGDLTDDGSQLKVAATQRDGRPEKSATYTIPNTADLLIAHATYDGYYAWRNADEGSWFIQALCLELSQNGTKHDILRLMTNVNRRVAFVFKSYTPANKNMDQKKQMSTILSTLTRLLYFKPKTCKKNPTETKM